MKIRTKDTIVRQVLRKMDERSLIGQEKYGSTMYDEISTNKKDLNMFLIDVQEEIMDTLLYIEAARACLRDEIEQDYLDNCKCNDCQSIDADYNCDDCDCETVCKDEEEPLGKYYTRTVSGELSPHLSDYLG